MDFALMDLVPFLHPGTDADLFFSFLDHVHPQCTGLWCRDLCPGPTETTTTTAVFYN